MNRKEILLGVNIDHAATLRQARMTQYPDPVSIALIAENNGADSITLHLREDRRHIQDSDVYKLKEVMKTPMNLEMAVTGEMLKIAEQVRPEYCCLVPERREELTTEGGLNVYAQKELISEACNYLTGAGIRVSLFIDADIQQINAAKECGAGVIEIHTGHFADASDQASKQSELDKILKAIDIAGELDLIINAGHGLNYENVAEIAAIPQVNELNIGHSIIAMSLFSGIEKAVSDMKRIMLEARS